MSDADFEGQIDRELKFISLNATIAKKHLLKKITANLNYAGKTLSHLSFNELWQQYQQIFNNSDDTNYANWIDNSEHKVWVSNVAACDIKFSIIVPIYNSKSIWLQQLLQSVNEQSYTNWQLILVDDASDNLDTLNFLKRSSRMNWHC